MLFLLTLSLALPALAAPIPAPPQVAARAYLLQDFNSGRLLAQSNIHERMEPASLTKLMTAYIVFSELESGTITLSDQVRVSEAAWRMGGSRMFIEVNKLVSVEDLLKGMIVQSGNDASVALAEHVAGSEDAFVSLMNSYAEKLGMTGTHFVNSTGMPDPDHYTTANDLAILTRALIADFPQYYKLYSQREFTFNGITQSNRNKLLWRDKSVDGVKTGHTKSAGFCLIASAQRNDMRLISVVLGTKGENARAQESQKLLNYGFRFFETRRLHGANQAITTVRIWKGEVEQLPLGLTEDLYVTVPRGRFDQLESRNNIAALIMAPAARGRQYGSLVVSLDGEEIAIRPLVALRDVAEGNLWQRLSDEALLLLE
ncbi:MAG TPA: D-alanyl-D-alanine carboxypeptidase [Gammaproteobacteria bacterium]|nr:D-alanyl-D-alanine carboxypeptidase [Gammaproteobacteria bacterium]